jgi:hypothetical protein
MTVHVACGKLLQTCGKLYKPVEKPVENYTNLWKTQYKTVMICVGLSDTVDKISAL